TGVVSESVHRNGDGGHTARVDGGRIRAPTPRRGRVRNRLGSAAVPAITRGRAPAAAMVCGRRRGDRRSRPRDDRDLCHHRAVVHRFYRARYDAARTLEAFSGRLREQVDIEAVSDEVLDVVRLTLRTAHATLWLRPAEVER